ncbi:MAG: cyclic pyranopterin monophosphate synthase MoaC [Pseudomonadota bacterium]
MSEAARKLSHIGESGDAHMVDVGAKPVTSRTATARGEVIVSTETLQIIETGNAKKGDVLGTARLAGIMAAKKTHDLIPLCHPLALTHISVTVELDREKSAVTVEAHAKVDGKTGVEMEALTACSVACLTVYDMVKAVDRGMVISDIKLIEKTGGQSGDFVAEVR